MKAVVAFAAGVLFAASSAAVVAAAADIESIVVSGPIFGALGVLLAVTTALLRWRLLTVASLSLPLIGLVVLAVINVNRWSPTQAQWPVTAALLCYELLAGVLWLRGLWWVIHGSPAQPRPWQFPLRSLLLLMFVVAVSLGAVRLALRQSRDVLLGIAIGLLVAVICLLFWLLMQAAFMKAPTQRRRLQTELL